MAGFSADRHSVLHAAVFRPLSAQNNGMVLHLEHIRV
jgi:hypothetical protein